MPDSIVDDFAVNDHWLFVHRRCPDLEMRLSRITSDVRRSRITRRRASSITINTTRLDKVVWQPPDRGVQSHWVLPRAQHAQITAHAVHVDARSAGDAVQVRRSGERARG